jgi:murein DD-endopeptidase MepM/ murein hydrolase activator NlpD
MIKKEFFLILTVIISGVLLPISLFAQNNESVLVNNLDLNPSERISQLKSKKLNTPQKNLAKLDQSKKFALDQEGWRFPFFAKDRFIQTQGYNGPFSHQGVYALDLANGSGTIAATKSGTITTLNFGGKWDQWCNSNTDCLNKGGVWRGNHILITHSDGSISYYLHMTPGSLFPGIAGGKYVEQGTPLAKEGSTGYTCGDLNVPCGSPFVHLHFQVNQNGTSFPTPFSDCGYYGNSCNNGQTIDDTYYTSTNIATGLVLNIQDKNIGLFGSSAITSMKVDTNARGSGIKITNDTTNQLSKWTWLPTGELKGINDWCLSANGTNVSIQDCNSSSEQKWQRSSSNGINNASSGLCLESLTGGVIGSTIQLASCNQSRNQQWRFGNQGYPVTKFDQPII